MYERFRIRIDTDQANDRDGASFRMPPPAPEEAHVERATGRQPGQPTQPGDPNRAPSNQAHQGREEGAGAEMEGVYIISVAARILDMHPQTLRKYERLGLINPGRTVGMLRLYSQEDIRKVFLIRHLMENLGLNLAGVEFALNLVENLWGFRQYLESVAEGTQVEPLIEPAMAQLFRNLNLPSDGPRG